MAAIDQFNLRKTSVESDVRKEISLEAWKWFYLHMTDKIVQLRLFKVLPISVRVGQLRPVFELLFGSDPVYPDPTPVS